MKTDKKSDLWVLTSVVSLHLVVGVLSAPAEELIFQQVAAGDNYTVAVRSDGTLWAWGENRRGQLGDGTTTNRSSPVQIGTDSDWQSVAAASAHTVALKRDGTLWAWGHNSSGQLGDGTTVSKTSPVQVGSATNWQSVAAGGSHTVALKSDGTLWAWGANSNGQLGDGTTVNKTSPVQIGTATNWQSVAAGSDHTVAVKSDGTLWAWGDNYYGQLGDGTTTQQKQPGANWDGDQLAVGGGGSSHTVALKSDGTLWAWGANGSWPVGGWHDGEQNPARCRSGRRPTGSRWRRESEHTVAVKSDGTLWAWGDNDYGQLGDGTTANQIQPGADWDGDQLAVGGGGYLSTRWRSRVTARSGPGATTPMASWGMGRRQDKSSPVQMGTATNWQSVAAGGLTTRDTLWR